MDYIILMDYIEDVAVIESPDNPSKLHLYQLKTKSSDRQYSLATVISDEWFLKLYKNAMKYQQFVGEAAVVCNTDIVKGSETVFHNEKNNLGELSHNENVQKIIHAIAADMKISEDDVDLSHFCFIKSTLSTKGHKEEVEHQFEDFLLEKSPDLQVATARSLFRVIYNELGNKFNNEVDSECSDIDEIFRKKGFKGEDIESYISNGLAIQLPSTDKLYSLFDISSIREIQKYNRQYQQLKIDMYSDKGLLSNTRKKVSDVINQFLESGVENQSTLLTETYAKCLSDDVFPVAFSDEHYMKMMMMIMIYKLLFSVPEE